MAGERAAEGLALAGEGDRALQRGVHRADGAERHEQPLPLEVGHDEAEALVLARRAGSPRGRRRPAKATVAVSEACQPSFSSLEALTPSPASTMRKLRPWWPPSRRRLDRGDVEGRAHAVGDVGLLAVDDVAAVDALGARGDRRDVGARARLGDGQGGDLLAGDGRRQVAALLVLGAELPHRRRGDADVRADPGRQAARSAARHLLGEDGVVQVVAALAAVLLGVLQARGSRPAPARRRPRRGTSARPPTRRRAGAARWRRSAGPIRAAPRARR